MCLRCDIDPLPPSQAITASSLCPSTEGNSWKVALFISSLLPLRLVLQLPLLFFSYSLPLVLSLNLYLFFLFHLLLPLSVSLVPSLPVGSSNQQVPFPFGPRDGNDFPLLPASRYDTILSCFL